MLHHRCIIYKNVGGECNMKNKLIKPLSLCMTCLTLTLLLSVYTQYNNFKTVTVATVHIIPSPNEDAPW